MNAQEFREMFPRLGVAGELLIANVIVENMTWARAIRLGSLLMNTHTNWDAQERGDDVPQMGANK